MQQHLKTSGLIGFFLLIGLSSRDLNMHLPQTSWNQVAKTTIHPVVLAENTLKLTMSRQLHH